MAPLQKGKGYMVDCNVMALGEGTSDALKYAMKRLFNEIVFPKIQELVAAALNVEDVVSFYTATMQGPALLPITRL